MAIGLKRGVVELAYHDPEWNKSPAILSDGFGVFSVQ